MYKGLSSIKRNLIVLSPPINISTTKENKMNAYCTVLEVFKLGTTVDMKKLINIILNPKGQNKINM